jgi:ubiquinone biosynthesis monooxygenase Coq7
MQPLPSWDDRFVATLDEALRALAAPSAAARPSPANASPEPALNDRERRTSAALIRVNRAGELAAQGLYSGQALAARAPQVRAHLSKAAAEERDHLAWCSERLGELDGRASVLDPVWYLGSVGIGLAAGLAGDRVSLGFIAETERQVEAHLNDHLARLPSADRKSAAVLKRMAADEAHHGTTAKLAGGVDLPLPIRRSMAFGGGMLRRIAYFV